MPALDQLISAKRVVVFSSTFCPFCVRAIALLKSLTQEMDVHDPAPADVRAEILQRYNHRTVPAIFISGNFIGGNSELQALHQQGKLVPLLAAAEESHENNSS